MLQSYSNLSLQVFHCHFNSNFFPLFLDALVGDAIAPGIGPMLIGKYKRKEFIKFNISFKSNSLQCVRF